MRSSIRTRAVLAALGIVLGASVAPAAGAAVPIDAGRIHIQVFRTVAQPAQSIWNNHRVPITDPSYVAVGGGATGAEYPSGAYLTASYPDPNYNAWIVSSKDHLNRQAHELQGYAIGMKIDGVSPGELSNWLRSCSGPGPSSAASSWPEATASVDSSRCTMISGGFQVDYGRGGGNIATASYPVNGSTWYARSKDHQETSPARITAYAVGLPTYLPVGRVNATWFSLPSGSSSHPCSDVPVGNGWSLTGAGARVDWSGAGNLLWKIEPYGGDGYHRVAACSKDHNIVSPATLEVYAMAIYLN